MFGGNAMPIYRLFQGQGFTPGHIHAMGTAFEEALAKLGLSDRSDPIVEVVAKKIIELGQQGERDPAKLRDRAIQALTADKNGTGP